MHTNYYRWVMANEMLAWECCCLADTRNIILLLTLLLWSRNYSLQLQSFYAVLNMKIGCFAETDSAPSEAHVSWKWKSVHKWQNNKRDWVNWFISIALNLESTLYTVCIYARNFILVFSSNIIYLNTMPNTNVQEDTHRHAATQSYLWHIFSLSS